MTAFGPRRPDEENPHAPLAISLAVLMIAALAGLCWLDAQSSLPGLWLPPVAVVFTVAATVEVLDLARQAGMAPPAAIVHMANLLLVLCPWAPLLYRRWQGLGTARSAARGRPARSRCGS